MGEPTPSGSIYNRTEPGPGQQGGLRGEGEWAWAIRGLESREGRWENGHAGQGRHRPKPTRPIKRHKGPQPRHSTHHRPQRQI